LTLTLFLHAGDFYDGPAIETGPVTAAWKELAKETPIFLAPGNHESYGDYAAFIRSLRDAGITVLEDQATDYDGVSIVGLRYRDKSAGTATANALAILTLDQTKPAILINHPPTFQKQASADGIDLMVSGHTHRGQFWPFNFLVRAIYGIYTYGKHEENGLTTITTSGIGTFGPPFRLFNTPELVLIRFSTK
jgi:uncharacterized protein